MSTNPNESIVKVEVDSGILRIDVNLTKREYFAAMALQGVIIRHGWTPTMLAQEAVEYADALIEELNKDKK